MIRKSGNRFFERNGRERADLTVLLKLIRR
jgi:hypothetical protein